MEEADNPKLKGMKRMFNVIGVSLSLLGVLKMSPDPSLESIQSIFAKPQVAELNIQAANIAYNQGTTFTDFDYTLTQTEKEPHTMLVQGYQGIMIGKMVCGCRFQPYLISTIPCIR